MSDFFATITEADPELVERWTDLLEVRAADPEQRAMLQSYLADIPFPDQARVLEIGCGTGAVTRVLAQLPNVAQATQSVGYFILPLMFLTTMFAPREDLAGWLAAASTFHPMTYLLRGMRSLTMTGWDAGDLGASVLAVSAVGAVSLTLAFLALRGRTR